MPFTARTNVKLACLLSLSLHFSCNRTCQPGQYGVNCNQTCSCHDKICDPVSGACYLRKKILIFTHATTRFIPPPKTVARNNCRLDGLIHFVRQENNYCVLERHLQKDVRPFELFAQRARWHNAPYVLNV